jgi:hypothetical protein
MRLRKLAERHGDRDMFIRRLLAPAALAGLFAGVVIVLIAARPAGVARAADEDDPATATANPSPATRAADKLTADQEAEIMAFLAERRSSYYDKMKGLKTEDPNRYAQAMLRMYSVVKRWQQMPKAVQDATNKERDAQLRIMTVVKQMRQADAAGKQQLQSDLERAVFEHFEAEQDLRGIRLEYLEQQLKELRDQLKQQELQRNTIIEERLARWKKAIEPVGATTRPVVSAAQPDKS